MKITPYKNIETVAFGESLDVVVAKLGEPEHTRVSRRGDQELVYAGTIYRFAMDARFVEVSADAPILYLDGVAVAFSDLSDFLRGSDSAVFKANGFIVSPGLGLAVDPQFPAWVTAFAEEQLRLWQAI